MTILLVVYFGFILPYLMGRTWKRLFPWRQSNIGITAAHGMGVVALLAVFYVASFLPLSRSMSVSALSHWMLLLGLGLGAVCLIILNRKLWQDFHVERLSWPVVAMAVVLMLLSVMALRPDGMDLTGELVRRMADSDVFYGARAYDGAAWEGANHSPIEAIYAMVATLFGMDATVCLHRMAPVILLVAYFGCYLEMGTMLFGEDTKARNIFLTIAMGFFLLEAFRDGPLLANVLCNPWNGQTILGSLVLPMSFALAYQWLSSKRWQCLLGAACLVVVGQLCYGDGAMMVIFLWAVAVVVALIRHKVEGRVSA